MLPEKLTIENFLEQPLGLNNETIKRTIIADYFNPKSILIEEDFYLKFPFKFTFNVLNPDHFQNQIGFLIYDDLKVIGKIGLTNKEI